MPRFVKTSAGPVRIESFALRNWRALHKVLGRMTAPEIRRAIDMESGGKRRLQLLLRLTSRLCEINRREAMAAVRLTAPKRSGARGEGRPKLTTVQIEARIFALFGQDETSKAVNEIKRLKQLLKRRQAEATAAAIAAGDASERGHLSKRALRKFRQETGDHTHKNVPDGAQCKICGELVKRMFQEGQKWSAF
jgi:hypothetical protein